MHQLHRFKVGLYYGSFPDWQRISGSTKLTHLSFHFGSAEAGRGGLCVGMPGLVETIEKLPSLKVLNVELNTLTFDDLTDMPDCLYNFARAARIVEGRGGRVKFAENVRSPAW